MEYERYIADKDCKINTIMGKCLACEKRFTRDEGQVFFVSDSTGSLHSGFMCVKCADEYEKKYLKK